MNFYEKSLTIEAWIYPLTIYGSSTFSLSSDAYIYTQINSLSLNQMVSILIRNGRIYGAFFGNDVFGTTMIGILQWQHVAFTYNHTTMTQVVYVDGVLGNHLRSFEFSF